MLDVIVLAIFGIVLCSLYFYSSFNGLTAPDAFVYGSLGKNIVQGNGMVSNYIDVNSVSEIDKIGFAHLGSAQLHPIIVSAFIYIFGATDYAVALSSSLFYILIIPVLYLFAKELFNRKTALVSTALYIISWRMLYYSISGLTEPLYIFLLLLTCYTLIKSKTTAQLFLVGILFGLSRITRVNSLFLLMPILLYVWFDNKEKRLLKCSIFLSGFIIATLPFHIKLYLLTGNPFYFYNVSAAAAFTDVYPKGTLFGNLERISSFDFIISYPLVFLKKYLGNLVGYYEYFLVSVTKPLIMAFFIVSLFRWSRDKKINRFKLLFFGMLVFQVFIISIATVRIRYFHIFIPFIIMFAVDYFFFVFEKMFAKNRALRQIISLGLILFLIGPTAYTIAREVDIGNRNKYYWVKEFLDKNSGEVEVVITDIGPAVDWYGNRKAISLPVSFDVVEQVDTNYIEIDAILLTNEDFDSPYIEIADEWKDLLQDVPSVYRGYEFSRKFENGEMVAVLYKKLY